MNASHKKQEMMQIDWGNPHKRALVIQKPDWWQSLASDKVVVEMKMSVGQR